MDRDTLVTLVKAHQAEVFRYLRYLGASRADAEDLVQETFLAAATSPNCPNPLDGRAAAGWLRGAARNHFLRLCRRKKTDRVRADSRFLERAEATWTAEFLRDGDGFDYVEALRKCLDRLTDRQRRAVDLRYAEKRSRAEMARQLDMTENGVKSLLRRIRAALGDCVQRRLNMENG